MHGKEAVLTLQRHRRDIQARQDRHQDFKTDLRLSIFFAKI